MKHRTATIDARSDERQSVPLPRRALPKRSAPGPTHRPSHRGDCAPARLVTKPKHPERSASAAAGPVVLRAVTWALTLVALPILIITPMTLHQQLTLSVVIFVAAVLI